MKRVLSIALVMMLIVTTSAFAFLADTDVEHSSVALGLSGQNAESQTTLIGVKALKDINGYVAGYAARQSTDGELQSEILIGRLQGGFDVNVIRVRSYLEGTRNLLQEIAFKREFGIFLESPSYTWQSVEFSAGGGNFVESRDLDDAIGRDAADAEVNVGALAFLTAELGHFSSVVRFKPNLNNRDLIAEIAFAFNKDLTERVSIQFTALGQYDTASVADTRYNNQYMIQFVYSPE